MWSVWRRDVLFLASSTLTDMQSHALLFGCTKQSDRMHASALRCTKGHLSSTPQTVHMVHFGINIPADTVTHWLPADSLNNSYYKEFQIGNTWMGFFKIWRIYLVKLIRRGGQNWLLTAKLPALNGIVFIFACLKSLKLSRINIFCHNDRPDLFNTHTCRRCSTQELTLTLSCVPTRGQSQQAKMKKQNAEAKTGERVAVKTSEGTIMWRQDRGRQVLLFWREGGANDTQVKHITSLTTAGNLHRK